MAKALLNINKYREAEVEAGPEMEDILAAYIAKGGKVVEGTNEEIESMPKAQAIYDEVKKKVKKAVKKAVKSSKKKK